MVVTMEHHSIYNAIIDVHIPLSLMDTFSHFKKRSLTNYEIENFHEYDVIYLSPEAANWNPANPKWSDQDIEFIDPQGYVKPIPRDLSKNSTIFDPM